MLEPFPPASGVLGHVRTRHWSLAGGEERLATGTSSGTVDFSTIHWICFSITVLCTTWNYTSNTRTSMPGLAETKMEVLIWCSGNVGFRERCFFVSVFSSTPALLLSANSPKLKFSYHSDALESYRLGGWIIQTGHEVHRRLPPKGAASFSLIFAGHNLVTTNERFCSSTFVATKVSIRPSFVPPECVSIGHSLFEVSFHFPFDDRNNSI